MSGEGVPIGIDSWRGKIDRALRDRTKSLNLNDSGMGDAEIRMQYLSEKLLQDSQTVLEDLFLARNGLGKRQDDLRYLADFLRVNQTVRVLYLYKNGIDDEGIRCLAEGLKVNDSVTELDLSDNKFGPEGLSHLAAAIAVNTSLGHIEISSATLDPEDLDIIEEALADISARRSARERYLSGGTIKSAAKC